MRSTRTTIMEYLRERVDVEGYTYVATGVARGRALRVAVSVWAITTAAVGLVVGALSLFTGHDAPPMPRDHVFIIMGGVAAISFAYDVMPVFLARQAPRSDDLASLRNHDGTYGRRA